MEPNQKINPEKAASKDKLHPGSGQSAQQKEKVEEAKSANTATQEAGLNKSEYEDQTKASLNKNDINRNIVDLEKEEGERSAEDRARTDGPYGLEEEGYDDLAEK